MKRNDDSRILHGLMGLAVGGLLAGHVLAAPSADPSDEVDPGDLADELDPLPGSDLDNVIEHWGEQYDYDYNCDGIVDVVDWLELMGSSPDSVTVLDFLQHWGEDTSADLDCDGVVGIGDMLAALAAMAGADAEEVSAQSDDFLDHWGEEGSEYDLNCDGIVDVQDFLIAVAGGDFDSTALLGMFEDWGQGNPYDLNCDGIVDIQDYLIFLADLADSVE